jgi:hypothetical protein
MSNITLQPRNLVLILIIVAIAALRLASFYGIGPLTVLTPLGAMALFGSAYFKGWTAPFAFTLLTLFISDVIVSFTVLAEFRVGLLYAGWYWTYAAFALIIVAGKFLLRKIILANIVVGVIAATVIHWLVANLGLCVQENNLSLAMYANKLGTSISYELRFFAGTALYSAVMFGGFALLSKKYPLAVSI